MKKLEGNNSAEQGLSYYDLFKFIEKITCT